mgnify:CR=1 FL=1
MTEKRPSFHTTWKEFSCRDGTDYPDRWRVSRAIPLAREFERVRAALGDRPLTILSAYRTPAYNARVPGAAMHSQHVQGRALDVAPPVGCSVAQLLDAVLSVAHQDDSALRGVGCYSWGVHIDIRPSDRLMRWSGTKPVQIV